MKYHFFTIAAQTPEPDQEALNQFCGQHRVVSVEKQFVAQGLDSFWSICVTTWRKRNLQSHPSSY